ncbi:MULTISPECIES: hypothetical protein [unclassified Lysobacter]|uniref:hypothetical protein n=1 Tax=unclassified Lysobacter TaxID=2635362 RepID=UPI0012DE735A|nr:MULTISPECIES: hypothetical protein [unclassified Lysobacter]
MKLTSATLSLILFAFCGELGASPPPHSPDYCGPTLCLEIPTSFGVDTVKATSFPASSPGQSEVEISGRLGKVTVLVKAIPDDEECKSSKSLALLPADGNMKAEALIDGPSKESCLHVSISFAGSPQHSPLSPPITAIWVVDKLPSTFWKRGYALRLGPQIDVLVSDPAADAP